MNIEDVRTRLADDKMDYLLAQYVDIHGTPRCKGIPATGCCATRTAAMAWCRTRFSRKATSLHPPIDSAGPLRQVLIVYE